MEPADQTDALINEALALHAAGEAARAAEICRRVLAVNAAQPTALHLLGVIALARQDFTEAAMLIGRALESEPLDPSVRFNHALALTALGRHDAALAAYDACIQFDPANGDAFNNRGHLLWLSKRNSAAVEDFDRAIALNPNAAEVHSNRAVALTELGEFASALESLDRAVALQPHDAEAHSNRGTVLGRLGRTAEALSAVNTAIALNSALASAFNNRGLIHAGANAQKAALADHNAAIALKRDFAEAHNNRGNALAALKQWDAALADYDEAIRLKPDYAAAAHNKGALLLFLKRPGEALVYLDRAFALNPGEPNLRGARIRARQLVCDWRDMASECAALEAAIARGDHATAPWPALSITGSPALQRKAAELWASVKHPHAAPRPIFKAGEGRIRVGYFSPDFRAHPVATLSAGLFESHDRTKFEIFAFSFGADTGAAMRKRLQGAFEHFVDVREMSDMDVVARARDVGLEIAVDLAGYSADFRAGIFAAGAAPLQLGYLGYPATMGASFMDYIVADAVVIPSEARRYTSEKVITLPCFQVNDDTREIAESAVDRAALGLPAAGVVFCCFNNAYKITPDVFARWMNILKAVPTSVLWLSASGAAADNLRSEARRAGVAAERLVFASGYLADTEHLARYRAADLFLDTLPYNAHATASDALWAGVPVLTCAGESYAGRVGASLLTALDLKDLIARSPQEYEALAIALARDPAHLRGLREKLAARRGSSGLFDTRGFTRRLEEAYRHILANARAGRPPEDITVGQF